MTDVMNITKKAFTWSVVVMTIAWSVGLSALAAPLAANAAECPTLEAGDLFKVTGNSAVYLVNADMRRMYFPHSSVYNTWYSDFSGVVEIDSACVSAYPNATNPSGVNFRPGSQLVKVVISPEVYAVGPGNMRHLIGSEAEAAALYGANWASLVRDVHDFHWPNYTTGAEVEGLHNGMLVKTEGSSDVWQVMDGMLHKVTGTLPSFVSKDVRTVAQSLVDALTVSSDDVTAASVTADPSQGGGSGPIVVPGGDLSVSLSGSTPAGRNLASGSALNEVLKVTLTAGSTSLEVDGFTFTKSGFVANTKITGVEVVDSAGMRHGSVATSIDSDNKVTITFSSNPIVVAAGSSETVTVRVNLASDANSGSLSLSLASAADVDTTANVMGSFPVTGNMFYFIDASSSIAATTVDVQSVSGASGTSLNVNDSSSQEITKFQFSETSSQEGVELRSLRLTNQGNADDNDYKNVQLVKTDGTVIATAQPDGDEVYFNLASSPLVIDEGENESLLVRATIVDGTTKTIHLVIEDSYDVALRGLETGSYVLPGVGSTDTAFPIGDSANGVDFDYNKVTISGGTLSFNKAGDSPSSSVAPGSDNVVLARFIARPTGEDYELRKVELAITTTTGSTNYLTGSVKVTVNGKTVYSVAASGLSRSSGSPTSITLSSYATLTSNTDNVIEVIGNVDDSADSDDGYQVYLDLTQTKKLISNVTADPSVSQTSGNIISVDSASLTLTTLSTPVAQSTVAGVNNFHFASFELNASGSGADVRVSSLTVSSSPVSGPTYTGINNLKLYKDGVEVATSNSTQTNAAAVTFTFVNPMVIAKDTSVTLQLKANVVSTDGGGHTFRATAVSATNQLTGEDVSESLAGSGQLMTVTGSGTVALSLVSGVNGTPTTAQVVPVGTNDGTYFSFKVTALNEGIKVRSLKLTASGTTSSDLVSNDLSNIRLYSSLDNYTTPIATAAQLTCSGGVCTYTWTAGDNLLASPVMPGSPVTFRVKANVAGAGVADLDDNFVFKIASSTGDITFVGASTGSTLAGSAISGSAAGTAYSYLVPFNVAVTSVSPTTATDAGVGSGTTVGVYKVTNNGSAKVTLTSLGFTNSGSATTTYGVYASVDGGTSGDSSVTVSSTVNNGDIGAVTGLSLTIEGGSHRYITVKTADTANHLQVNSLSVNALGAFLFSVSEDDLGYSTNPSSNSTLGETETGLYMDGKPSTAPVTHKSS